MANWDGGSESSEFEMEQLLQTQIDPTYFGIPSRCMRPRTLSTLSKYMNIPLVGKDWMMLANDMEYSMIDIKTFERNADPMSELLNDWTVKETNTVGSFLQMLLDLGREDVFCEIRISLAKDIEIWRRDQERQQELAAPVQVNEINTSTQPGTSNYPNLPETDELRGITLRDQPSGPPEIFDAYVCFCEEDRHFVLEMMKYLEKPPYNLKLCVDFRDLVPGCAYATATIELIHNRCKRMIIVLSPEFMVSEQCDFQAKVALSFSPGARMKRIVPILLENCEMPPILRHITKCDYTKSDLQEWFWERLFCALNLR